ncbi:branched-chain amino acid ABC transporter permease [Actinomadura sp. WMMB 499]|uniref:branched-chain amino acid ABC transporter permease n=1 Tax=Actinomadura sp. WMMB 499 TaxID=1219491 RepID=UPI00124821F3|nr:branched-chain amino acid ABC transporter permease [Actinomadura sp. WMMB 499]QFG22172.1 branched-chain amino acid ABC transporter permease [Actinomadura sp. WMMB 499]
MARRSSGPPTDYAAGLRLFPTRAAKVRIALVALAVVLAPYQLTDDWLQVLAICGCYAVGGIGLNLLTGYAGQVSLGHAVLVAVGGYTAAAVTEKLSPALPLPLWLLAGALAGAGAGALIGPFALRLHGHYLAIVTLALLFMCHWLFNRWTWLTGGGEGVPLDPPLVLGPFDFADLEPFGYVARQQGVFLLIWLVVGLAALLAANIARGRPGRAMQAVRDRHLAAEVCGVSLLRYKMGAFVWSSAFAAVGGALYFGCIQQFITPDAVTGVEGLVMSITFVAVIIVGGMGTIHGAVLGALIVAGLPQLINRNSGWLPFLGEDGVMNTDSFNNLLFGLFIAVFLIAQPLGVAGLWRRTKNYFRHWPFSG